jgi:hypothetical protein
MMTISLPFAKQGLLVSQTSHVWLFLLGGWASLLCRRWEVAFGALSRIQSSQTIS